MNDLPRHTLSQIILEHGRGICDAPKRIEAMLRDLCGAHRREINIITGAIEERVAADLIQTGNSVPRDVLLARLAARLRDNLAYTPEAARWAVETWVVALGILSEADFQMRARESEEASRRVAPPPVRDPKPPTPKPSNVSPQAPKPPRRTTYAPPQSPKSTPPPPIVRQPASRPTPIIQPKTALPQPPQQNVSPSIPSSRTSRRGFTLSGCLIGVVLIIALIVTAVIVVPAVIMLLQQEQARPSINEPRF